MAGTLIADSGSTKTAWCLISDGKKKNISTQGISPYFLTNDSLGELLRRELLPKTGKTEIDKIIYFGTGCTNPTNVSLIRGALKKLYPKASVSVDHDLAGAARAVCGEEKGIVSILGTGSNCGYFNGKKIVRHSPGLGYVLGDEGSGAYMGRKVLQHFLYGIFDGELQEKFQEKYRLDRPQILNSVYREPFANRYISAFAEFLSENRGHYMIENIIEDSFNDFFFTHLYKFREAWTTRLHFTGTIAYIFRDVLKRICLEYELNCGTILKHPMDGLVRVYGA